MPVHKSEAIATVSQWGQHRETPLKRKRNPIMRDLMDGHDAVHHKGCSDCRHDYAHRDQRACGHNWQMATSMPLGHGSHTVSMRCTWCSETALLATGHDAADVRTIAPAKRKQHTITDQQRRRINAMTRASH